MAQQKGTVQVAVEQKYPFASFDYRKFRDWYEKKFKKRMPLYIPSEEKRKLTEQFAQAQ